MRIFRENKKKIYNANLTPGSTYYYVVTAFNAYGESAESAEVSAKPQAAVTGTTEIDLGGGVKMQFAEIPAGTFTMGEVGTAEPVHQVTISKAFYMGKCEVTQAQYQKIAGTNPSYFISSRSYPDTSNQPVEQVSWFDCVRFCNKLSVNQSLTAVYKNQNNSTTIADNDTVTCDWAANGYRLPTEAEWEYACRAGTTGMYYWANAYDEAQTKQYAWYERNADDGYWTAPHADKEGTQPVGMLASNSLGLYDMSGNVWEWCWDWYGSYSSSVQTDPKGADFASLRVLRGGSWYIHDVYLRSAYRDLYSPAYRSTYVGFRVVGSLR